MTKSASFSFVRHAGTPPPRFNGVKVFSATMHADREFLGEKVTEWIRANPELTVVEIVQTQSSDEAFHCIALSVFYFDTRA